MVSCERAVRAGRGLVQYAGILTLREWIALSHCAHGTRPLQDLGPGTGDHQGRGRRLLPVQISREKDRDTNDSRVEIMMAPAARSVSEFS